MKISLIRYLFYNILINLQKIMLQFSSNLVQLLQKKWDGIMMELWWNYGWLKSLPFEAWHGQIGMICDKRTGKGPLKIVSHSLEQSGWLLLYRKKGQAGYAPFKISIIDWDMKEWTRINSKLRLTTNMLHDPQWGNWGWVRISCCCALGWSAIFL